MSITDPPAREPDDVRAGDGTGDGVLRATLASLAPDPLTTRAMLPQAYEELKAVARRSLRNDAAGAGMQTTDLAHEALVKLCAAEGARWDNRAHFFGAAARAMRQILVDRARRAARLRHGGGHRRVPLDRDHPAGPAVAREDLLSIDEALAAFEALDPVRSRVVELKYFGGLTIDQIADLLGIGATTVSEHWAYARAWLHRRIGGGEKNGIPPGSPSPDDA